MPTPALERKDLVATHEESQDVPEHHRDRGKQLHGCSDVFVLRVVVPEV